MAEEIVIVLHSPRIPAQLIYFFFCGEEVPKNFSQKKIEIESLLYHTVTRCGRNGKIERKSTIFPGTF